MRFSTLQITPTRRLWRHPPPIPGAGSNHPVRLRFATARQAAGMTMGVGGCGE
ncbi:MAG: hypothetical protein LBB23_02635 [Rickettsiales bacterium]|nr:hypothetical protein [Rickettsiales bacterium]